MAWHRMDILPFSKLKKKFHEIKHSKFITVYVVSDAPLTSKIVEWVGKLLVILAVGYLANFSKL